MFIEQPIDTWQAYIENLDMPNYYVTFSALVANILSLIASVGSDPPNLRVGVSKG